MPYLSASAVVIHYEEALCKVYAPLPLLFTAAGAAAATTNTTHYQYHDYDQYHFCGDHYRSDRISEGLPNNKPLAIAGVRFFTDRVFFLSPN